MKKKLSNIFKLAIKSNSLVYRLLLLISCICFFSLRINSKSKSIIIAVILALFSYLFILSNNEKKNKIVLKIIVIIVSSILTLGYSSNFAYKWSDSNIVSIIVGNLGFGPLSFLYYLEIILKILSIYYVYFFILSIIEFISIIDFKKLLTIFSKYSLKNYILFFSKCLGIVLLCSLIGMSILFGVFYFQNNEIEKNVSESAYLIQNEGTYPDGLDNLTDSIMLLEACNQYEDSIINRALLVYRECSQDFNSYEVLIQKYVYNKTNFPVTTYSRYWHGYLIFIMPLLSFINYIDIRILNGIFQSLLITVLIIVLILKKRYGLIIPILISYLMMRPLKLACSLQLSSCFYITFFGCALVLKNKKSRYFPDIAFLFLGILLAYFDFLTYPAVTLGLPLTIYIYEKSNDSLEERLFSIIKLSFLWLLGYSMMWGLKTIIPPLLTGHNDMNQYINSLLFRVSNKNQYGENIILYEVFESNIKAFMGNSFIYLIFLYIFIYLYKIFKKNVFKNKEVKKKEIFRRIMPYAIIFCLPILWYTFVTNHSAIHIQLANRELVISIFAIMISLLDLNEYY